MSKQWPIVQIGDVLTQVSRREVVDTSKDYRLLGVRWYGEGLFTKAVRPGREIRARLLYRVEPGDFVYNRLFAWKGSFAVATSEADGAHVSNEFPCFAPSYDRLDPKFLLWYFRRKGAWAQALGLSSGATSTSRNRLKESLFLRMEIPLPPLAEQQHLVVRIEALAAQIHEVRSLCEAVEPESHALLMGAYRRIAETAPYRTMAEVAPLCRRPVTVDTAKTYPQVAVRSFGRGTFHKPVLLGSEVTWQKPYLVRAGDILISNIKAWEGAIAVASPEDDRHVGSHRYLTCVPVFNVATARFVCFRLLSPEGLYHIGEASPGSADRNRTLSAKELLRIPIPTPSYAQQVWFDELCTKVDELGRLLVETAAEIDALLPSVLDRAFRDKLKPTGRRLKKSPAPEQELVHVVVAKPVTKHSKGIFYRRAAIDCYLISVLQGDTNLGRTKIEKLSHLIEYHCGVDLEREPVRDAAGPNDYSSRRKVESLAGRLKWYSTRTQVDRAKVDYVPGLAITKSRHTAERLLGDRKLAVDALLRLMRPLDTKQSEIVATLYAAWNDFLLAGKKPTDNEIVDDVRNNWHPKKRSIPVEQWLQALTWMRKHQLVPRGVGRATLHRRQH